MYDMNSNFQNNKASTNSGMDRIDDTIHNYSYYTSHYSDLEHDSYS